MRFTSITNTLVAGLCLMLFVGISSTTFGQCEYLSKKGYELLEPFKSDGQFHRALLTEGETAEFVSTFYAGTDYRIVGVTGPKRDSLIFKVLDSKYNLLFSNEQYDYAQFWDFKFNATGKYYIQAELMPGAGSGCVVIMIGFEPESGEKPGK
jgi:hypothetical protein